MFAFEVAFPRADVSERVHAASKSLGVATTVTAAAATSMALALMMRSARCLLGSAGKALRCLKTRRRRLLLPLLAILQLQLLQHLTTEVLTAS